MTPDVWTSNRVVVHCLRPTAPSLTLCRKPASPHNSTDIWTFVRVPFSRRCPMCRHERKYHADESQHTEGGET